ncbi:MAG: hypothetical protein L3J92_02605 [Thermoplasmata archaeon]|jgi:DNA-binding PadR family transcriptional regulator|nr:hypothetical protein [Thermoplasmata archaeon]
MEPPPFGDPGRGIGLAARVILHLSHAEHLGPNDAGRLHATQQGMVAALSARQSSLVKVLQSLLASGVVVVERRFVADADRHMRVYRLTPLGQSTARNIERRAQEAVSVVPPSPWTAVAPSKDRTAFGVEPKPLVRGRRREPTNPEGPAT